MVQRLPFARSSCTRKFPLLLCFTRSRGRRPTHGSPTAARVVEARARLRKGSCDGPGAKPVSRDVNVEKARRAATEIVEHRSRTSCCGLSAGPAAQAQPVFRLTVLITLFVAGRPGLPASQALSGEEPGGLQASPYGRRLDAQWLGQVRARSIATRRHSADPAFLTLRSDRRPVNTSVNCPMSARAPDGSMCNGTSQQAPADATRLFLATPVSDPSGASALTCSRNSVLFESPTPPVT